MVSMEGTQPSDLDLEAVSSVIELESIVSDLLVSKMSV